MKRNDPNATPDRISNKGFRTPLSSKPPVWSPILHATTPDLNATEFGCQHTPALIRSLGINPDLDVSWSSAMATPTNAGLTLHGIKEFDTVNNPEDKSKPLQRRHLFANEQIEGHNAVRAQNESSSPGRRNALINVGISSQELDNDIFSFLKKSPLRFIYPEPIYIGNCGTAQSMLNTIKYKKQQAPALNLEDQVPSPVVGQREHKDSLKEIQRSREFINRHHTEEISFDSGEQGSGEINQSSPQSNVLDGIGEQTKKFIQNHSARMCPSHCVENVASNAVLESLPQSTRSEKLVSAKIPSRARTMHNKEVNALDLNVVGNLNRPPNMPEFHLINEQTFLSSGAKVPATQDNLKQVAPSHNLEPKFSIGFSTASGKKVAISEEAMIRAKNLFEAADESNLDELSTLIVTKPTKDDINFARDDTPSITEIPHVVSFQLASGKNIVLSEDAIAKAKALLEDVEQKSADSYTESKQKVISTANQARSSAFKPHSTREKSPSKDFIKPSEKQCFGFSTASGKNVSISEEALIRAKRLFDTVDESYLDEPSTSSVKKLTKAEPTSQSESIIKMRPISKVTAEIPRNIGFNTASGKTVTISEASLSRANKLFEETISSPIPPEMIDTERLVKDNYKSPPCVPVKDENTEKKRKMKEIDDEDDDDWISSPTIGKKKKKLTTLTPRAKLTLTPISGTPSAFEDAPTFVSSEVSAMRRKARQEQKLLIQFKQKKTMKTLSKPGLLYQLKNDASHVKKSLEELVGKPSLPEMCPPYVLLQEYGMLPSVCLVQASNASSFNFFAWEHFSMEECRNNSHGVELGEFEVILSDDNTVGCEEIGASFLASSNVDPTLVNLEWIRNHYRWIVWKLASMELRIPALFARTCLTPKNVLEQLKYRYDKEIDRCQRSALRRIIEQDDTPAKTMILCVAEIRNPNIMELSDGWYSIDAHCDQALMQLVEKKKIFVGVKLAISGAELGSPGPSSPLEKGPDTYLKISANSTRRARWNTKLGFYSCPLPFPIKLTSVLADGGIVSHVRVNIIRVYPMVYMEKRPDGKTVFHGERQYRKISESATMHYERVMEKLIDDIEREEDEQDRKRTRADGGRLQLTKNLTDEEKRSKILDEAQKRMRANMKSMEGVPMLRLRVIDWRVADSVSAIVSIWRPSEELRQHLKEGKAYHLYNVIAAGIRVGELQLNATKHTSWNEIKDDNSTSRGFERSVTSFSTANQNGFKPMFYELDLVGLVVYVGQQQVKGPFQTAVLTDGTDFFGVKCWGNFEDHALSDVIVVGAFLAFSNLQWRTTASRTVSKLSFAFIHEGTLVSARPAQKHLDAALQDLKHSLSDPDACVAEAESHVNELLGSSTPQSVTPKLGIEARRGGMLTPTGMCSTNGKKDETPTSSSISMNRARLLEKYGAPPALSPWSANASPHVRQKFKPPARKPSSMS